VFICGKNSSGFAKKRKPQITQMYTDERTQEQKSCTFLPEQPSAGACVGRETVTARPVFSICGDLCSSVAKTL
jgi:hypothetical protein